MQKYSKPGEKNLKGLHPQLKAKEALVKAEFSSREREEFFNEAFGELMHKYFMAWLTTDPHETNKREFIYTSVLALGDVKQTLIGYEMYGKNVPFIEDEDK